MVQNAEAQHILIHTNNGTYSDSLQLDGTEHIEESILHHYYLKAHFQASIDSIYIDNTNHYHCQVSPGPLAKLITARIITDDMEMEVKDSLGPQDFTDIIDHHLMELRAQGYYHALIHPQLSSNSKELTIDLYIHKGERNKVERIIKQGYRELPDAYLEYNYNIYPGAIISDCLSESNQQQWGTDPLFTVSKVPDLLFYPDSTILYLYTNKRQSNSFDALMGMNTDKNGKVQFNGYADIRLINTFNKAEELKLYWKGNGAGRQDLRFHVSIPYILNSSLGVLGQINMTRQDSSWFSLKLNGGLSFALNAQDRLQLSALLEENSVNSKTDDNSNRSYSKKGMQLTWTRKGRTEKEIMGPSFYWNSYVWYNLRDDGNSMRQMGAAAEYSLVKNIHPNHYVYIGLDAYWMDKGENAYNNELRRIGGFHSIRGFKELQIASSAYAIGRTEYRFLSGEDLYLYTITDLAYYHNPLIQKEEWLMALGTGMSLSTRAGRFSLAWAMGKQEETHFNPSQGQLHFGYISKF